MSPAAFPAFDPKNAKDNGPLPGLKPPSVITVTYQTAGMTTIAAELIYWKICCNFPVNLCGYPLEACERNCYHDSVAETTIWLLLGLSRNVLSQGRVPAFCIECRLESLLS